MAPALSAAPPGDPFPPLPQPNPTSVHPNPSSQNHGQSQIYPNAQNPTMPLTQPSQPVVSAQNPPSVVSYASATRAGPAVDPTAPAPVPISTFKGESAVEFLPETIAQSKVPFQYTLVGKFTHGKAPIDKVRDMLIKMQLKSDFVVGIFDSKHVMIKLNHMEDYQRLFSKDQLFAGRYPLRTFRWSQEFNKTRESSIAPVWVLFPELPINFFNAAMLCNIAAAVGRPLKLDTATLNITRPSVARICVEVDLLKPPLKRVWIGCGERGVGFWQHIEYEYLPSYCTHCYRQGHGIADCIVKNGVSGSGVPSVAVNKGKGVDVQPPVQILRRDKVAGSRTVPVSRAVETVKRGIQSTHRAQNQQGEPSRVSENQEKAIAQVSTETACVDNLAGRVARVDFVSKNVAGRVAQGENSCDNMFVGRVALVEQEATWARKIIVYHGVTYTPSDKEGFDELLGHFEAIEELNRKRKRVVADIVVKSFDNYVPVDDVEVEEGEVAYGVVTENQFDRLGDGDDVEVEDEAHFVSLVEKLSAADGIADLAAVELLNDQVAAPMVADHASLLAAESERMCVAVAEVTKPSDAVVEVPCDANVVVAAAVLNQAEGSSDAAVVAKDAAAAVVVPEQADFAAADAQRAAAEGSDVVEAATDQVYASVDMPGLINQAESSSFAAAGASRESGVSLAKSGFVVGQRSVVRSSIQSKTLLTAAHRHNVKGPVRGQNFLADVDLQREQDIKKKHDQLVDHPTSSQGSGKSTLAQPPHSIND